MHAADGVGSTDGILLVLQQPLLHLKLADLLDYLGHPHFWKGRANGLRDIPSRRWSPTYVRTALTSCHQGWQ